MNNDTPAAAIQLKPCPFCGQTPQLRWHSSPKCWVECECGAVGPNDADTTTDENMAAWNTRTTSLAAQDCLVDALRKVRECRLPAREKVQTIHGVHDIGECWNVSGLTKLLPEIDAALESIEVKS